jgi:hypothetical protein
MTSVLKGNYQVPHGSATSAGDRVDDAADTKNEFERGVMERLGGSIAFVVKKDFVWKGDKQAK